MLLHIVKRPIRKLRVACGLLWDTWCSQHPICVLSWWHKSTSTVTSSVMASDPCHLLGPKFFAMMSSCQGHVAPSFLTFLGASFEALHTIHQLMSFLKGDWKLQSWQKWLNISRFIQIDKQHFVDVDCLEEIWRNYSDHHLLNMF